MDWSRIPPLAALRAFSAFAEHGTLQRAGRALNISHAAISQHIRNLEDHTGLSLLDRTGRKAELTSDGVALAKALQDGFGQIGAALDQLTGTADTRALQVATTPSFAAGWLLPRLADFRARHPEIDITFDASPDLVDFTRSDADLAIRFGKGSWPGLDALPLVPTRMVAVAAPSLVPDRTRVTLPELRKLTVLQEIGTSENTLWLARHGLEDAGKGGKVELPGHLTLDAARAGQGIAVAAEVWVQADLAAGRLVKLFEDPTDFGYFIVTRRAVHRQSLKVFLKWLRAQARD